MAVGRIRKNVGKAEEPGGKKGNERSMRGNNFVAFGRIRKKSKNPENSGNEKNRKGNNFATARPILIRSEKSGDKNPEMTRT